MSARSTVWFLLALFGSAGSASATVYTVRPDGQGLYPTIQSAINAATNGDVVQLADGVFSGDGNRDLDFKGKQIAVESASGDPTRCSIDCQGSSTDPHRGFYFHTSEHTGSQVIGLTVMNGWEAAEGSAVLVASAKPTLNNCIFRDGYGAAVTIDPSGSPVIENCQFVHNHNDWQGGALSIVGGNPSISGCVFSQNDSGNSGGAVYCSSPGQTTFTDCQFLDSSAGYDGGAIFHDQDGTVLLTRCLFVGNTTTGHGGGVNVGDEGWLDCEQCTFADNTSTTGGSALNLDPGSVIIVHFTIFAFGTYGAAIDCHDPTSMVFSCTDIYGNVGGDWGGCIAPFENQDNNFSADPLFCGNLNPDEPWSLQDISPCAPGHGACGIVGAYPVGCGVTAVPGAPKLTTLELGPISPSPCRAEAAIGFSIPSGSAREVTLAVFDSGGRRTRALAVGMVEPGVHRVVWDGRDGAGVAAPAGLYFVRLECGGETRVGRILRIR